MISQHRDPYVVYDCLTVVQTNIFRAPNDCATFEQIVLVLMDLYSELGDNIALQYGGSEAHKKVSSSSGPGKQASQQANMAISKF